MFQARRQDPLGRRLDIGMVPLAGVPIGHRQVPGPHPQHVQQPRCRNLLDLLHTLDVLDQRQQHHRVVDLPEVVLRRHSTPLHPPSRSETPNALRRIHRRVSQELRVFDTSTMRNQDALDSKIQHVHHRLGVVVLQHADNRHRAAGKTALHQAIDRRGVHGAVFAIEQHEVEPGVPEYFAKSRIGQADRARKDRASRIQDALDRVAAD